MNLESLLDKRLIIVSGKGGVGKSTVCAALALIAARRGRRVLTIEIDSKERISQLFGVPEVGHEGRQIYENIWAANLQPAQVMDEFVYAQMPLEALARQVIDNPIYQYFVAAAPGLKELVTLGKIMLLEEERESRRSGEPKWDFIIIDAPATGHGISFLRVPYAVVDTLKVGPVYKQAKRIINLLTDKKRTRFILVTLAEEMPTNEAIEMYHTIQDDLGIPLSTLIINGVYPKLLTTRERKELELLSSRIQEPGNQGTDVELLQAMVECVETAVRRRELNERYIKKLVAEIRQAAVEVPFIFSCSLDFDLVELVAESLESSMEAAR